MLHLGSTAIHHLDDHGPSGDEDELLGLRDVLHIKASCGESSLIYSCHVCDIVTTLHLARSQTPSGYSYTWLVQSSASVFWISFREYFTL